MKNLFENEKTLLKDKFKSLSVTPFIKNILQPHNMSSNYKVFLAGLEFDFTEKEVYSMFSAQYSSILRVDIVKQGNKKGRNKGFGFMILTDPEEVKHMLGQVFFYLRGRKFLVKEHKEGDALQKEKDEFYKRRIFIKNVAVSVNNKKLWDFFSSMVELEDAYLIKTAKFSSRRRFKGKEKGGGSRKKLQYGFVVVKNLRDVDKIVAKRFFLIEGFRAEVQKFDKKKHQICANEKKRKKAKNQIKIEKNSNFLSEPKDPKKKESAKRRQQKGPRPALEHADESGSPHTGSELSRIPIILKDPASESDELSSDLVEGGWQEVAQRKVKNSLNHKFSNQKSQIPQIKKNVELRNQSQKNRNRKKSTNSCYPCQPDKHCSKYQNNNKQRHLEIQQRVAERRKCSTNLTSVQKELLNYFAYSEVATGDVRFAPLQHEERGKHQRDGCCMTKKLTQQKVKTYNRGVLEGQREQVHTSYLPIKDNSQRMTLKQRLGLDTRRGLSRDKNIKISPELVFNVLSLPRAPYKAF